jgi:hypothetical protein
MKDILLAAGARTTCASDLQYESPGPARHDAIPQESPARVNCSGRTYQERSESAIFLDRSIANRLIRYVCQHRILFGAVSNTSSIVLGRTISRVSKR